MISRKDRQKAKRLKSVRDRHHLTQEKMAERLDISYSTYQRMESGGKIRYIVFNISKNGKWTKQYYYRTFGKVA